MKGLFREIFLRFIKIDMAKSSIDITKLTACEKRDLLIAIRRDEEERTSQMNIENTLNEIKRMEKDLFSLIFDYHAEIDPDIKHRLYHEIDRMQNKFCKVCFR